MNRWTELVDKKDWNDGPWDDEADKMYWYSGFQNQHYLMLRGPGGTWNGYVSVPWYHPAFFCHYDTLHEFVDVHGGLTFSAKASHYLDWWGIKPNEIVNPSFFAVKWFGFDTAHFEDMLGPAWHKLSPVFSQGIYRDENYVHSEMINLGIQLKEITWALILKKIANDYRQTLKYKMSQSWSTLCLKSKEKSQQLKSLLNKLKTNLHA
jgi:hypothetical protein